MDSPTFKEPRRRAPRRLSEDGINFDSEEELVVYRMLEEAKQAGAVKLIERAPTIVLCEAVFDGSGKKLLEGHSYTPDFRVVWDRDNEVASLLTGLHDDVSHPFIRSRDWVSLLEVKPVHDAHGKSGRARIDIKWVFATTGVVVQMIKVGNAKGCSFEKLWTPEMFNFTPVQGIPRSLKYKSRSFEDFLEMKRRGC